MPDVQEEALEAMMKGNAAGTPYEECFVPVCKDGELAGTITTTGPVPTIDNGDLREQELCRVSAYQPGWFGPPESGDKTGHSVMSGRVSKTVEKLLSNGYGEPGSLIIIQVGIDE